MDSINTDNSLEIKIYEPISEVQNIISVLVENIYNDIQYQSYLSDLESNSINEQKKAAIIKKTFTDIRVFNTNTDPLFLAKDIGILMGIVSIRSAIKNYNNTEKVLGVIIQNGKPKKKYFLTRHGVYRIMFNSRAKISEVFRGFIYKLIDHMYQYELDKLKNIIVQYSLENPDQVKESLIELHDNVNKFRKLYEIEKREREIWALKAEKEYDQKMALETEKVEVEIENSYNEMLINELEYNNKVYLQKIYSIKDDSASYDDDKELLEVMKQRFLKEVNIFVATPQYVEKLLKNKLKKERDETNLNSEELGDEIKKSRPVISECGIYISDDEDTRRNRKNKRNLKSKKTIDHNNAPKKTINHNNAPKKTTGKKNEEDAKNATKENPEETQEEIDVEMEGINETMAQYKRDYQFTVIDFRRDLDIISDKELYYYIVFKKIQIDTEKYTHIYTDWVMEKNKYIELIDTLKSESESLELQNTKKSGDFLFKTSVDHIKSITRDLLF